MTSVPQTEGIPSQHQPSAAKNVAAKTPVGLAGSVHSRSDSKPSASSPITPAVPSLGGPTIANGSTAATNNAHRPTASRHEHSRKTSVTISAAGTSGQMPNGGPVAGKQAGAENPIQFGSLNANGSPGQTESTPSVAANPSALAVSSPQNQRAPSPSNSPSPIPNPPASGGRPPASLHAGTGLSFGSMGGEEINRNNRPGMPPGSLTPNMQTAHMRRDSSHSGHNDMNNGAMNHGGGGRGGFQQGGRGRGYHQPYPQSMSFSPGQQYRGVPPAPRGGHGMPGQYMQNNRPMQNNFPNSPHQATRSPSLSSPAMHQQQQGMQMHPGAPMPGYGPPQMQYPPQGHYMQQPYDQSGYYYANQGYGMPPQGMPMNQQFIPQSPQPPYRQQQGPQQFVPNQYQQPPTMSRTSSGAPDRPPSAVGPQAGTPSHHPSNSRGANSPGPKGANFQIPARKSGPLLIKDPTTGAVKTFDKSSSPAPNKSPANSAAATPPPPPQSKTPVIADGKTEGQTGKSYSDKAADMKAAVAQKIKDDEEKERLAKEKEAGQKTEEEEVAAPAKPAEEAKPAEPEPKVEEAKPEPAPEPKVEEAPAAKEPEPKKEEPEEEDEEEFWRRYEEEEARKEAEREAAYQAKKKIETEAKKAREAEENARRDEELKKAEREAEEREEARVKGLDNQEDDSTAKKSEFEKLKVSANAFKATQTSSAAETPAASGTATPASDTSSMGPPATKPSGTTKQKPAALKLETNKQVESPQPSAALQSLRSAKFLTKISNATYPEAVRSPNPALNAAAGSMGKFRYDKDFLLQFQKVFTEKPSETWNEKIKETVGDTDTPQSARRGGGMGPRAGSSRGAGVPNQFPAGAFGDFRQLPPGTTSQQRFEMSNRQQRPGQTIRFPSGASGPFGSIGLGGQQMIRTGSNASNAGPNSPRPNHSRRGQSGKGKPRENERDNKAMPLTKDMNIVPIKTTEKGWKPMSVGTGAQAAGPPPGGDGYLAPDVVQRKVKASLNKMTPSTFDKISAQILEIVQQSQKEEDGRTLRQVIGLTFEKATDEAHWASMYAEFCSRMLVFVQQLQPEIKDTTLPPDKNGKVNAGGTLFRKYLLNRCQQDFEAGWKDKLPDLPDGQTGGEAELMSEEYYKAAAAKRRGLGLVRFIGELFKLNMLTSRIMHMCVKRLVDYEGIPDEGEVESLTSLLKTIGANLDSEEKARPSMDAYFERINNMMNVDGLPSRLKFMLMDIVDLRRAGWKSKNALKGPATIEEIRAQALAEEREKEAARIAENAKRGAGGGGGGGRMPMGRGDARNFSGGHPPIPNQNTVGMDDLRRLTNKVSRQASSQGSAMSFGPTSMFNRTGSNTRRSMGPGALSRGGDDSRTSSRTGTPPAQKEKEEAPTSTNAFSALASLNSGETDDHPGSPPSNNSSPALTHARLAAQKKNAAKDESGGN